jgi:hypothetical protein
MRELLIYFSDNPLSYQKVFCTQNSQNIPKIYRIYSVFTCRQVFGILGLK